MTLTKNQLIDYASLFSSGVTSEILQGDFSRLQAKIERYDPNWFNKKNVTYFTYLKYVYRVLQENHKNEYVYKNEFLNKWLLDEIAESNASLFNEFRVGNSVADLVIFNGTSKVFEIKSHLDTNKRLGIQIEDYQNAFNETYIIIPHNKIAQYNSFSKKVGIITYNENNVFKHYRQANVNTNVCYNTVMNIMHTREYKSLVQSYYGKLPEMNSFNMYDVCFEHIKNIPKQKFNDLFIKLIKKEIGNQSFQNGTLKN